MIDIEYHDIMNLALLFLRVNLVYNSTCGAGIRIEP
jgi:hypothetical protein